MGKRCSSKVKVYFLELILKIPVVEIELTLFCNEGLVPKVWSIPSCKTNWNNWIFSSNLELLSYLKFDIEKEKKTVGLKIMVKAVTTCMYFLKLSLTPFVVCLLLQRIAIHFKNFSPLECRDPFLMVSSTFRVGRKFSQ